MSKVSVLNHKVKELGINRVAKLAGFHKSTLSRYLKGQRQYSLENFDKVLASVRALEQEGLRGRVSAWEGTRRVVMGEDWQIAYFDFVDAFLATKSEALI